MVSRFQHWFPAGIYVIRRRQLIELIERCAQEDRYDFVKDILIRYKNLKRIYGYKMDSLLEQYRIRGILLSDQHGFPETGSAELFLHDSIRIFIPRSMICRRQNTIQVPDVKNSLVSSGCIINGYVENSILFKKAFVGENCVIKNSIILNDVYLGDNTHIENCIVESRDTIRANSYYVGEDGVKIVIEKNERYVL